MPKCELKYTHEEDVEATVSFLEMPATNPEARPGEHYDYEACDACALYVLGEMHPADNRGRRIAITFRE